MIRIVSAFLAAAMSAGAIGFDPGQEVVEPSVRYLGQAPPGTTPVRFAPGIVSTPAIEINGVFRPDFREFFFARQVNGVFTLFCSTLNGRRSARQHAGERGVSSTMSPGGDRGSLIACALLTPSSQAPSLPGSQTS